MSVKNLFRNPDRIKAINLKIGDLGIITDYSVTKYLSHTVLRTYTGLVSLNDPESTWDEAGMRYITVEKFNKGDSITIVQD